MADHTHESVRSRISFGGYVSELVSNVDFLGKDLAFFVRQARTETLDDESRGRSARVAIVFLAFYVESLSNSVFFKDREGKINPRQLASLEEKKGITKPKPKVAEAIRKLRLAYNGDLEKELDCTGLQDLFTVRNEIFAHAQARSTIQGRNLTKIEYVKEIGLPHFYSEFEEKQLNKLIDETAAFLKGYERLMGNKLEKWQRAQFRLEEIIA